MVGNYGGDDATPLAAVSYATSIFFIIFIASMGVTFGLTPLVGEHYAKGNKAYASQLLRDSTVKVCTVVGFPLGACMTDAKACEARYAAEFGAQEIDMVINVGMLKAGNYDCVLNDISQVVSAVHGKAVVKVIIETCLLTDAEKNIACRLACEAGADFVKTSTGFSTAGATVEDVALMKAAAGGLKVKAAGGIRTYDDAVAMLNAGADRIGASASIAIVNGCEE